VFKYDDKNLCTKGFPIAVNNSSINKSVRSTVVTVFRCTIFIYRYILVYIYMYKFSPSKYSELNLSNILIPKYIHL
jgi:hypothetical protein